MTGWFRSLARLVLAACLASAAGALPASIRAQQGDTADLEISSPSHVSPSDDQFEAQVVVKNVTNLGGFEIIVSFDPNVLRATSISKTDFLGSTGREVQCPDPTVEDAAVRLLCVSLRAQPAGPDGDGPIATIGFETKSTGSTDISISPRTHLLHPDASDITASQKDGHVRVESGGISRVVLAAGIGIPLIVILAVVGGVVVWRSRRGNEPHSGPEPLSRS